VCEKKSFLLHGFLLLSSGREINRGSEGDFNQGEVRGKPSLQLRKLNIGQRYLEKKKRDRDNEDTSQKMLRAKGFYSKKKKSQKGSKVKSDALIARGWPAKERPTKGKKRGLVAGPLPLEVPKTREKRGSCQGRNAGGAKAAGT